MVEKRAERDFVDMDGRVGWYRWGLLDVNAAIRGRFVSRKVADMNFMFANVLCDELCSNFEFFSKDNVFLFQLQ